jgi:hypothetical protein
MAEHDDDLFIGTSMLALFNAMVVQDVADGKWKLDALGTVEGPRGTFNSGRSLINAISETSRLSSDQMKAVLRLKTGSSSTSTPVFDVPSFDGEVKASHQAPEMTGTGTARKAAFVNPDQTVEADWVKTFDVRNPAEFLFSILGFDSGQSLTQLIGSGSWLTLVMFAAAYHDSEPTAPISAAEVALQTGTDLSGEFPVSMSPPGYTESPLTVVDVQYPGSVGGTVAFRLTANQPSVGAVSSDETITFLNNRYRGVRTSPLPASGAWTSGDVAGLAGLTTTLTNAVDHSYTAESEDNEYDVLVLRDALGTPKLKVNEFWQEPQDGGIVSITNANGFTEDYRVWILENQNAVGATVEWSS